MIIDTRSPKARIFFGHTQDWWEKAILYYNLANPDKKVDEADILQGFASGYVLRGQSILEVMNFWGARPSQANLLLPRPEDT